MQSKYLTAESVQGSALAFQSVYNVHGCDGLSLGMLAVCYSIPDHILEEYLQDTTSLFVDEPRDTLDTTTTSKTTDSRLGDTLDVITQNLTMTLGATLSQTLSSFTTSRHDEFVLDLQQEMMLAHCAAGLYTARFADLLGKMVLS